MKISVIIPIYGVEKYITQCVDSVINQSYHNIEVILVDDESPDHCPQICDEYAEFDERIKVIHKKNGGLSDARNAGIMNATGEYVMFLDGDDYWNDEKAIEKLVVRANQTNPDVLNFSYQQYFEDTGERKPYFDGLEDMPLSLCHDESLDYLTRRHLFIASACNKMVRRSLFGMQDLYFKKGIYSEDIDWCARLLVASESMDFVCENAYCYRQRSGSITHTTNLKKCNDLCNNIIACVRIGEGLSERKREYLFRYTAYMFGTFFVTQAVSDVKPKQSIEELSHYQWLLRYNVHNPKLKALYIASKLIGYKNLCSIIRWGYTGKYKR